MKKTHENLLKAIAGESMARNKYTYFADCYNIINRLHDTGKERKADFCAEQTAGQYHRGAGECI